MPAAAIIHRVSRAVIVYRDFGFAAVWTRLWRRVLAALGADTAQHAQWLRNKRVADTAFDSANGTQTGGIEEIFGFNIVGDNARHGLSHIASDPAQFNEMIRVLGDLDLSQFTFVDLGSGKGRAVLLAAAFPFRRVIGVEFAAELHEAAKANLEKLKTIRALRAEGELVHGDAANYDFPNEPLLIYLFNPFGSHIVRQVATRALDSWRAEHRPICVIYMNPTHLTAFTDAGWIVRSKGPDFVRLAPPVA